jgi:hypothetical protein
MLNHENRVRDEFTRQAETFSASSAMTDAALTHASPSAVTKRKTAREVVAFGRWPAPGCRPESDCRLRAKR